ncbi:MAG: hypothetical protein IH878_20185 [Gemmatimonadetes bacterium]|nr:hypothetical protein [Gemmatimonadota bacterium]
MRRVLYYLTIVLMVLWTAVLVADLTQVLLSSGIFAATPAEQTPIQTAQGAFQTLLPDLWGPAAQARAIVWGLPMIVFALIAAITQR